MRCSHEPPIVAENRVGPIRSRASEGKDWAMAMTRRNLPARPVDMVDRLFDGWPTWFRCPVMVWPDAMDEVLGVDEYRENGTEVIRDPARTLPRECDRASGLPAVAGIHSWLIRHGEQWLTPLFV